MSAGDEIWLPSGERAVVLVAHPDDETIGCSVLLARLGGLVTLVQATDGAPRAEEVIRRAGFSSREEYAEARRAEVRAALSIVGVAPEQHVEIGLVDQEAAESMPLLAARVREILLEKQPAFLLTHAYEGGHPDHDACAFAARAAVDAVERERGSAPALLEMALYHRYGGSLQTFTFVPAGGEVEYTHSLDEGERVRKARMYACHASQKGVLAALPIGVERARRAPLYDFRRPPYSGTLQYETFSLRMTKERWLELAAEASGLWDKKISVLSVLSVTPW